MTPEELKAWFEGFTEGKKELSADDLKRVKVKIAQLRSQEKFPQTWGYPSSPLIGSERAITFGDSPDWMEEKSE